jgi:hypothetical protein
MKNKYVFEDKIVRIFITRRSGDQYSFIIDKDDFEKISSYGSYYVKPKKYREGEFYVVTTVYNGMVNGKPSYSCVRLHRIIMNCFDEDKQVDHRDYDDFNNCKENLRITTNDKNTKHRSGKNSNNTSGHRNVSLDKRKNEWMVQLQDVDGKTKCFKRFPYEQLEEAAEYAELKRQELYGEFAGRD